PPDLHSFPTRRSSDLDEVDRNLMLALLDKYGGGPVGLGTLSAALAEEEDAIEEMYEPYLMQIGMIDRTPRGRVATPRGVRSIMRSEEHTSELQSRGHL